MSRILLTACVIFHLICRYFQNFHTFSPGGNPPTPNKFLAASLSTLWITHRFELHWLWTSPPPPPVKLLPTPLFCGSAPKALLGFLNAGYTMEVCCMMNFTVAGVDNKLTLKRRNPGDLLTQHRWSSGTMTVETALHLCHFESDL